MPVYKYLSNRFLTVCENLALGQNLGDFHSGFRVYRREVLETIPFEQNSDDFVFDTQFLAQAVRLGFRLGDVPVPVRYFDEASSINFRRSLHYGLLTLGVMGHYWLDRLRLWRSPLVPGQEEACECHRLAAALRAALGRAPPRGRRLNGFDSDTAAPHCYTRTD